MKKRTPIWAEGYQATYGIEAAMFLGWFDGDTFDEAVISYNSQTMNVAKKHKKSGLWHICGVYLFDSEIAARKKFG